eukprot:Gb_13880 [translate_table: standard]
MFLNVVDCNGELKDATFIANIFINAIESVGPSNVVQVIIDNARVCKVAELLVEARYENIFWTPFAEMFITNHHMTQAIYRQFASFILLRQLLEVK